MTRDNVLFVVIGLLAGFISGYFVHEGIADRQAPRRAANVQAAAAPPVAASAQNAQLGEIARLRQFVEEHPEDADAILSLANLNYDIRSWARARELYERHLELAPPTPDVLTDLGVCLRGLGLGEEAVARFREAQALSDSHWQSLFNEVVVLAIDQGDLVAAESPLARLQELQPDNESVARLAAEIDQRRGQT